MNQRKHLRYDFRIPLTKVCSFLLLTTRYCTNITHEQIEQIDIYNLNFHCNVNNVRIFVNLSIRLEL